MPGILPYSVINNEVYFLLGKEKGGADKGTWCMLSGKKDASDPSLLMAACREAHEESAGLLGSVDKIAKQAFSLNKSKSTFLLEIKDPKKITNGKFHTARASYADPHYREMSDLKWVKAADVINACVHNKGIFSIGGSKEEVRPFVSKIIAKNANYLQSNEFLRKESTQQRENGKANLNQKSATNNKPKIYVNEIKSKEKVDLIKKIAADWALTASSYKDKYKGSLEKSLVALDAEDMALTINMRVNIHDINKNRFKVLSASDSNGKIWGVAIVHFSNVGAEIQNLVVNPKIIKTLNPKCKTSGVGTSLIKKVAKNVLQQGAGEGPKQINLSSLKSAISFYKKLGFKEQPNENGANTASQDMSLSYNGMKRLVNS